MTHNDHAAACRSPQPAAGGHPIHRHTAIAVLAGFLTAGVPLLPLSILGSAYALRHPGLPPTPTIAGLDTLFSRAFHGIGLCAALLLLPRLTRPLALGLAAAVSIAVVLRVAVTLPW